MALDDVAARLAAAGAELAAAASTLPAHDPGADAFGADATGRLGALGHELHRAYLVALDSRVREVAAHGGRLSEAADLLARAVAAYATADDAAGRRHREAP
ncbi:hypothetical protein HC031_05710 [Planosporangium thailandense]|uniref:Excreted virulence factor EspC (Type VII ESX diderm) n=1 Tax=Planosporangium thailandense TaxID=765197 RepID=A0ABX0XT93_9ACTN|nr:hypothetical protein [Planosporangium thailandense]NJC69216.1 hypothetical protein [Planosporangium thailandense]